MLRTGMGRPSADAGGIVTGGLYDANDAATASAPIVIPGTSTWTLLTNDALGPFTNVVYGLPGKANLWDTATQRFVWAGLSLGDVLLMRLDISVTTTSPNQDVLADIRLGAGVGEYSVPVADRLYKAAGVHRLVAVQFIYMGDTNTFDNPAVFRVQSDAAATVVVHGWATAVLPHNPVAV